MSLNPLLKGLPPVHPGELLKEDVLPAVSAAGGPDADEIARHLGLSAAGLAQLLDGVSAVTPETALRLGRLFGNGAEFWARMQSNYDLRIAHDRAGMAEALDALPVILPEGRAA